MIEDKYGVDTMSFSDEMIDNLSSIKTKYDLSAFCYHYLKKTIDNEISFLGEYIEKSKNSDMANPNFGLLNKMAYELKKILERKVVELFSSAVESDSIISLVTYTEKKLKNFGKFSYNNATIPFYMLWGLELYFQDCSHESYKTSPLNDYLKEQYLIYVTSNVSIMDHIMKNKNYPKRIKTNDIRNYFKHMIIIKTSEIPEGYGIPKLVTLRKDETYFEQIVESKKIKLALIPTVQEKWFDFRHQLGGSFVVEYDVQKTEMIKNRVLELLERAIKHKVNIIIFPEYICSEEIQSAISEYLLKMNRSEPEKLKDLLFVVTGSGWTEDSNNVSCLYGYDGMLLGKVYKYSAYDNDIDGEKYVERLQNPGKEITLINIPKLGIFQTEICRNVSEKEFSFKLSQMFDSQFLLISAWSSSINIGFKKQIDAIISSNYRTCSALCNCCAVVSSKDNFRRETGIVAVPQKKQAIVEGRYQYPRRTKGTCDMCCEKGCFFEVCYDFSGFGKNDVGITINHRKNS